VREAAAYANLPLVPLRDRDRDPGRQERAAARRNRQLGFDRGAQIAARGPRRGVGRQIEALSVRKDSQRHRNLHDPGVFFRTTMRLSPGLRLGPYEITAPLGRGGMGEVYRARDTRLGREVAVKILPDACAADAGSLRRFEKEARAIAALAHPNIVPLFDVGEQEGVCYAVAELVEGKTLRERLAEGPLPVPEAADIAAQVAEGLEAAHEKGLVHRDIKPENIMLTGRGLPKILDFGLARRAPSALEGSEDAPTATFESAELGEIAGTVGYMSPEQIRGEPVDARSDIFSLGVVLYEMVGGRRPFSGQSKIETLNAILKEEPVFPPAPAAAAGELERILRRCLEKRRDNRYHSAADLAHDLRRAAAGQLRSGVSRVQPAMGRARSRRWIWTAAASLLLALAGYLFWRPPRFRSADSMPRTLAVLPFRTIGPEAVPHFGLGLADSLIARLASVRKLTVRPTSAISRFDGTAADAIEAGRQLGVEAILEGTLQRLEGSTRVSVQLTDVSRGAIVWSDRLDLPEGRLFEVQDEIAKGVVERLRLQLDPAERRALKEAQPIPDDLMEEFFVVRARLAEANRMSHEERRDTIERLDRILERVPTFARALGARAYARFWFNFQAPSPGGHEALLSDAKRALELDPELTEPRVARALAYWSSQGGWKFVEAVRELKAAVDRSQGLDFAHVDLSRILHHYGWMAEARRALEPAKRLNPMNAELQRVAASHIWYSGDPGNALAEYGRISQDVRRPLVRWPLLQMRLQTEEPRSVLADAEAWVEEGPTDTALPYALLAVARVRGGRPDISDLERRISSFDSRIGHFHHVYVLLAEAHAQKGDTLRSVTYLRHAADTGFPCLVFFDTDPLLAPIRASPEYRSLRDELAQRDRAYRSALEDVL